MVVLYVQCGVMWGAREGMHFSQSKNARLLNYPAYVSFEESPTRTDLSHLRRYECKHFYVLQEINFKWFIGLRWLSLACYVVAFKKFTKKISWWESS